MKALGHTFLSPISPYINTQVTSRHSSPLNKPNLPLLEGVSEIHTNSSVGCRRSGIQMGCGSSPSELASLRVSQHGYRAGVSLDIGSFTSLGRRLGGGLLSTRH